MNHVSRSFPGGCGTCPSPTHKHGFADLRLESILACKRSDLAFEYNMRCGIDECHFDIVPLMHDHECPGIESLYVRPGIVVPASSMMIGFSTAVSLNSMIF